MERVNRSCIKSQGFIPVTWIVSSYSKKAGKDKKGAPTKLAKVELSNEEVGDIIDLEDVKKSMQEAVDKLKENYIQNLSLRTTLGSFDKIIVETNEGNFHLNEVGQIVQKSPHLLMINLNAVPQYVTNVKKALENSGMNINPQQEGLTLFIPIPKVTREHREKLAKNAKTLLDSTKTHLTNLNNKYSKKVNTVKNQYSEDLIRNINNHILDLTHQYTHQAEKLMESKRKELLAE